MFNKKLFGYAISLRRGLLECEHQSLLGKNFYVHRKDLTELAMGGGGKRQIQLILDQIKSKQPIGLSDDEFREYFDREMKKRGFRELKFPEIMRVTSDYSYFYYSAR